MTHHALHSSRMAAPLALAFVTSAVHAFSPVRAITIVADDARDGDQLGLSVCAQGQRLVVGAPLTDDACPGDILCQSGAVYVFERGNDKWNQVARIVPETPVRKAEFGGALDIDGDVIIVGARGEGDAAGIYGVAYVFERGPLGWKQIARLEAPDRAHGDSFGGAVAIDGDWIAVASDGDDDRGLNAGSVHLFERREGHWTHAAKLVAPDGEARDAFGVAIDLSEDHLFVGALNHDGVGNARIPNAGAVYVFARGADGWALSQKLNAPDAAPDDKFGSALAAAGPALIVGAPFRDSGIRDNGAAFVFERTDQWRCVADLAPRAQLGLRAGAAVAIDAGSVCVAWPLTNLGGGAVYARRMDGWSLVALRDGQDDLDQAGWSVALAEGIAILGVVGDDTTGASAGGVLALDFVCASDLDGDGLVGPQDLSALLADWGGGSPNDLTGDGAIGPDDLSALIGSWGVCPDSR